MGFLDFFNKNEEKSKFLKLVKAIETNNLNKFKKLLKSCNNLNQIDEDGFTLLHYAVLENNFEIIELLINHNIYIDTPAKNGHTALSLATEEGYLDLVKYFLELGAKPENYKDDLNSSLLHLAVDSELLEMVIFFLNEGIDINSLDSDGDTPFILAASMGSLDIIEYLAQNGADINILNKNNQNALHESVYTGSSTNLLKYLVELGLDKNIKNKDGQTPLDIAKESEWDDIVEYFESLN